MGKGFQIFLVCLLAFVVVIGAVCIIVPLVRDNSDDSTLSQPVTDTPEDGSTADSGDSGSQPTEDTGDSSDTPAEAEPTKWEIQAQEKLETMTLEEKVYQLFMVTPEALTGVDTATVAGSATQAALAEKPVGGIVYFAKNLQEREQAMKLLSGTQSYASIPLLLGVDEEGGTVSRVGSNSAMGVRHLPDAADYDDPQAVYDDGKYLGGALLELGFNLDFAPVADVVTNPNNTEIGRRSYSSDPTVAAQMVGSMVSGLKESGILCTLKHFPGHGSTETDTHDGRAVTERTLEEMREAEFLPFQAGIDAGAPMVMVGHLSAPAISGNQTPSDLSRAVVTDVLRQELGFQGVIVTDAQNMGAITDYYSSDEAAVQAISAGVDLVLMPADLSEAADGVLQAVEDGTLTEARIDESVTRILAMKYEYGILT